LAGFAPAVGGIGAVLERRGAAAQGRHDTRTAICAGTRVPGSIIGWRRAGGAITFNSFTVMHAGAARRGATSVL